MDVGDAVFNAHELRTQVAWNGKNLLQSVANTYRQPASTTGGSTQKSTVNCSNFNKNLSGHVQ
jgi:hypothetical protein